MTVTESPIEGAVETVERGTISSHLHPEGSFVVSDFAVPTGLEEIWRFTPLKRLRGLHDEARLDGLGMGISADVDDVVTAAWVAPDHALRGSSGMVPIDRVSARAWQAASGMFLIDVPAEAEPEKPLLIDITGLGVANAVAGHLLVNVGAHARATVVLRFEGSAVLADNVEIVVGDGAQLTLVSIQDWADDAVHHTSHHAKVGRDARLKHVAVSFGGDLVRMDATTEYDGPGGDVEMLGLYFADAGQHIEHRLFVDHNEPRTRSHVTYKGALQGQDAHAVWIGNVLIRQEAEGIETYEENRNLVLTDGCQADSVPNLEIETGEIKGAGHASATGRFDDEQLFYLRSRGIEETEARRLVVHGFFNELVRRIAVPEIAQSLIDTVEAELSKTVGVAKVATA